MLTLDKEILAKYRGELRLWQGIPSIEVTKKGRTFLSFYSGGTREEIGNAVLLIHSDDGVHYSDPTAAAIPEKGQRCFDSSLWIDPLGRLWFCWSVGPLVGVYAAICDDPDGDELVFGKEFFIGKDIMMNRPTVLKNGDWLFPLSVWDDKLVSEKYRISGSSTGAYAYLTRDRGKTFEPIGKALVPDRWYDEHMFLEKKDGSLSVYVRTHYGIGVAHSHDGGRTWDEGSDSGLGGPCSRFHIRRLASGRILLINHVDFRGRNNLTALLSEDEGETWPYRLLIDGRDNVSYPDAKETEDGFIYLCHDRERGAFAPSFEVTQKCAREILVSKITEADIMAGKLVSDGSYLCRVAHKLTEYKGVVPDPYTDNTKDWF